MDQQTLDARLTAHWAAQLLASATLCSAAAGRMEARPDMSHSNLGWRHELGALVTHPVAGVEIGLVIAELTIVVACEGEVAERYPLAGRTLEEGLTWLEGVLDAHAGDEVTLTLPTHDMPHHEVSDGDPFPEPTSAHGEVSRWFATAHDVVSAVAAQYADLSSPARCWPHHFDLATLIIFEPHEDSESEGSVGFGMTPGDAGIPEPYFYATPWPRPEGETFAPLSVGAWHIEDWTGAVLRSTDRAMAEALAAEAVPASRMVI
ncbi:MAG: hypothetical protein ACE366_00005 [Bradymonadia bacterium]